jgi:hypothetical protein
MRADCDSGRLDEGMLRETFSQGRVDQLLERLVKFPRPTLQDPGKIVVDGESCSHADTMMLSILMSRHQSYKHL